ncbi:MAG: hypothetical protein HOW73_09845 [Polyangiaceae bacterium]|nr:hypothetical protein [Polyangiaceae bacterium]
MSKPYVIRISETVRRHVVVEDGVEARLDLLEILPRDDMSALLEAELERRGFVVAEGNATRDDAEDIGVRIDVAARRVHVGIRKEDEVALTLDRSIRSEHREATDDDRAQVVAEAEVLVEREREARRRDATQMLERKLGDLRAELDEVVVKVTQEALRRRAGQIGEIQSIEEDAATGSMTIRVRV